MNKQNVYAFLTLLLLFLTTCSLSAQNDVSLEFQVYPTGYIPTFSFDKAVGSSAAVTFRLGANIFDHRDLGVQDEEVGSGFGGSIGYKKYFSDLREKWFIHVRSDFWWNEVDWVDLRDGANVSGETSITVIQPTASIGYAFVTDANLVIAPSFSLGFEWNVRTSGDPTGEGSIILLGILVGKRF